MSVIKKIKIGDKHFILSISTVPDVSVTPKKFAKDMNFTKPDASDVSFLFNDDKIRLIGGTETTVGHLLRHNGKPIETKDLKNQSVTLEKLSSDVQNMLSNGGSGSGMSEIPDGSVTEAKLAEAVKNNINQALWTANDALSTAVAVEGEAVDAGRNANQAKTIAENAKTIAEEAKEIAENASSTSNNTIEFSTESYMNSYILCNSSSDVYGFEVPDDGKKYYAVFAADDSLIYYEDVYGEQTSDYASCFEAEIIYEDGYTDRFRHLAVDNEHTCEAISKFEGRIYVVLPLINGKTVSSRTLSFQCFYGVGGIYVGNMPLYNPTSKVLSDDIDVELEKCDADVYNSEGDAFKLTADDDTLRSLLTNDSRIANLQHFYVRETKKAYLWNGVEAVEIGGADLTEVKNGLQSILDAVNGILEGGASA